MNDWYEHLHRSEEELTGADATLVARMRECYTFLRTLSEPQVNRMLFLTDTTIEERIFWAGLGDILRFHRPWSEELKERMLKR